MKIIVILRILLNITFVISGIFLIIKLIHFLLNILRYIWVVKLNGWRRNIISYSGKSPESFENVLIKTKQSKYNNQSSISVPKLINEKILILSFLGSGGHTSEMFTLLKSCIHSFPFDLHIIASESRSIDSLSKLINLDSSLSNASIYVHKNLPRAREVKQSWWSTPFTSIYSLLVTFVWYFSSFYNIDAVILNGPGTCVILVTILWIEWILTGYYPKVYYIESVARVESLSLTGKILYKTKSCYRFFVQWKELHLKYPNSEFIGRLC